MTLLDLVDSSARDHPSVLAIVDGELKLTWSEYRDQSRAIAVMLIDLGIRSSDVVGLHMVNRAEHVLADIGVLMAGGVPTTYYDTLAADQLTFVVDDSASQVAIVDADKLALWLSIRDRLPRLRHLIVLDLSPDEVPAGVHCFEELLRNALEVLHARAVEVDKVIAGVRCHAIHVTATLSHVKALKVDVAGVESQRPLRAACWSGLATSIATSTRSGRSIRARSRVFIADRGGGRRPEWVCVRPPAGCACGH